MKSGSESRPSGNRDIGRRLPAILADLRQRLQAIEAACNPEQENLHFGVQVRSSPAMLEALYDIGLEAWHAVEYEQTREASFWFYDWFLLIANVSLQIWHDNTQGEYSDTLATRLALLLVDISQMTTKKEYEGDIRKRLFEALAHVLLAFGKFRNLWEIVTTRAEETKNEHVIGFVQWAVEAAQKIERDAHKLKRGGKAETR